MGVGGEEARGVRKALLLRMCVYVEGVTITQMGKFIYDRNTRVQKQLPRPCVRLAKNNFFVLLPPRPHQNDSLMCDKCPHSSQKKKTTTKKHTHTYIYNLRAPRYLFLLGIYSLHMLLARHVKK